jgi:hypothetical protein
MLAKNVFTAPVIALFLIISASGILHADTLAEQLRDKGYDARSAAQQDGIAFFLTRQK